MFLIMLFFVTITVFLANAQAASYTDCGSELAAVEMVEVSGCSDNARRCVLKRNTNVTINIDFTPSVDVSNPIQTLVHGVILGVPVPSNVVWSPDACQDSGMTCPLKSGERVSYRATFPVYNVYPRVTVDVKWELMNSEGKHLVCILIPAKIM